MAAGKAAYTHETILVISILPLFKHMAHSYKGRYVLIYY